ncbi:hypothetical protein SAMD00019534_009570 [Acytostelium subglobosum LB1]|uniref:hypothetical protein n=1 Tax=Acytostelium subglobosum LB1 TaxID=1410327 RepID=UPI0006449423|nr:hypothetical protein SAMD00019534_009570 [Acytostelium subglobosum LB1]GAM17782.1 hypothetical protein SAMD00019534_009570 [Acytostelium subglobosum LB1]|eukprot:XP_012758378.1 hypothetical protein SAMD00019534_009570 [Acytostelium subglobosum LB1]
MECVKGKCFTPAAGCMTDGQCDRQSLCLNGKCVPYSTLDGDCSIMDTMDNCNKDYCVPLNQSMFTRVGKCKNTTEVGDLCTYAKGCDVFRGQERISPSETYYIQQGVENGVRADGRTRLDYRHFELDVGEIAHACGSARILLDNTHVIVGIKADIASPTSDAPNHGMLNVNVDCCPSASPEFEGKGAEYINVELAKQLERLLTQGNALDLASLCIVPGKYCWNLYIDAIVLDSGGNLFDALSIATRAALYNTRLPQIKIVQGEHEQVEFEVSEDPESYSSVSIDNVPICVTLTKIGTQFVLDSTLEEELCMDARLTIGVNRRSNICSIQKGGVSGLDSSTINQMITVAKQAGLQILKSMDAILIQQQQQHQVLTNKGKIQQ